MAEPFFKVKATDVMISDQITAYSYWNMPWGKVLHTPISGGAYLQNTTAGTLRINVTLAFDSAYPNATLDKYFTLMELERADAQTLYRFRDLQGWTRDVQIAKSPFGDDATSVQDLRHEGFLLKDRIEVPLELIVPGYLPVEIGP